MADLIPTSAANDIRRSPVKRISGCGEVALVTVRRRSTCRSCGRPIPKGAEALETVYDFMGGGLAGDPFTGTVIRIHPDPCERS